MPKPSAPSSPLQPFGIVPVPVIVVVPVFVFGFGMVYPPVPVTAWPPQLDAAMEISTLTAKMPEMYKAFRIGPPRLILLILYPRCQIECRNSFVKLM